MDRKQGAKPFLLAWQEDAFLSRVVGSMGSNLSYERARERRVSSGFRV